MCRAIVVEDDRFYSIGELIDAGFDIASPGEDAERLCFCAVDATKVCEALSWSWREDEIGDVIVDSPSR